MVPPRAIRTTCHLAFPSALKFHHNSLAHINGTYAIVSKEMTLPLESPKHFQLHRPYPNRHANQDRPRPDIRACILPGEDKRKPWLVNLLPFAMESTWVRIPIPFSLSRSADSFRSGWTKITQGYWFFTLAHLFLDSIHSMIPLFSRKSEARALTVV
jgi:hypothetical protein